MTRLVRVLAAAEAVDGFCSEDGCEDDPTFEVATPIGPHHVCEGHLDGLIASLPADFVESYRAPERLALAIGDDDDIPF